MPLSFADLLNPPSLDAIRTSFLTNVAGLGYITNWAVAGAGRALAEVAARGLGDLNSTASLVAMAGLLDFAAALADTSWLDALAWGFYDEVRKPATIARLRVRLTSSAGAPTATIAAGELILSRSDASMRYRNVLGGTLGPASHLDLDFDAENVGTAGNIHDDTVPVQLVTTLAGITAALLAVSGSDPTVTAAVDAETNAELAARCRLKWATLAYGDPGDKLSKWALDIGGVTKTLVDDQNPRGPGTVDIYLASDTGTVGSSTRDAVQALFDARKQLPSNLHAYDSTKDSATLTATVFATGRLSADVLADVKKAVVVRNAAATIGDGSSVTLYVAQLIEDLMAVAGVYNVIVTAPASDVVPALGHIAILDPDAPGVTVSIP